MTVTGSSLAVDRGLPPPMAQPPHSPCAAVYMALVHWRSPSTGPGSLHQPGEELLSWSSALVLPAAIPVGLVLPRRPPALSTGQCPCPPPSLVGLFWSLLWAGLRFSWISRSAYHSGTCRGHFPVDEPHQGQGTFSSPGSVRHGRGFVIALPVVSGRSVPGGIARSSSLLRLWCATMSALLVLDHLLKRPHVSQLVPMALLVAAYCPPCRIV